jgi:uncharacterized protein YjeT (DUF2065 family)
VKELICLLGLVFLLEGGLYFLIPRGMKGLMERIPRMPDRTLRLWGLAAMLMGLFLVYAGRR